MQLTPAEINDLVAKYQLKDGTKLVNYRDFINKADQVFSDSVNTSEEINAARSSAVSYKITPDSVTKI